MSARRSIRGRWGGGLAVAGVGRNGRRLIEELDSRGLRWSWLDDDASAVAPGPRVTVGDLDPSWIVVVTPNDRDALLTSLRATGARIILPEAVPDRSPQAAPAVA